MDESKQPKTVRTVADALREMPVGTRFTRENYRNAPPWKKVADDVFTDGDVTMVGRHFGYLDHPHDDPIYGIVILSTPDAVPPKPEQPAGVVVTREWLEEVAGELEMASIMHHGKLMAGYDPETATKRRDDCARLAADSRRKAEPK